MGAQRECIKVNSLSYAKMLAFMMDGTMTLQELTDATGLHYLTVCQYTRDIYKAGVCHICMYEGEGKNAMKVYKLGAGKDVQRQKLSGAVRQAAVRTKKAAQQRVQVMAGTGRYVQARNGRLRFETLGA